MKSIALALAVLVTLAFSSSPVHAQATGTYQLYGAGCAGSGAIPGGTVLPKGYASTPGNSANSYPWGYFNLHYMQAFAAADFPGTTLVRGLEFRNRRNYAQNAYALSVVVRVGYTNSAPRTLNRTFASNWSRTPTVGFSGTLNVPSFASQTDPTVWTLKVPFRVPFIYSPALGNFLWECENSTATRPSSNYFDSISSTAVQTSRLFANGATNPTGSLGTGYGVITRIIGAGSTGAIVKLTNTGVPVINRSFQVHVSGAVANSVAVLWLGAQQLNVSLSPTLPGCTLYTSLDVLLGAVQTGTTGSNTMTFALPNDRRLVGIRYFNQWMVLDSNANSVGVVFSNGGDAKIGG